MQSKVYQGRVFHQRLRPKKHRLSYRVFSFLFDIDELPDLDKKHRFFSHNRFNLISFWNKDHGPSDEKPLRPYVEDILKGAGVGDDVGRIELLCYPRLFGYVFNPLSVYYCYDKSENLNAIIYEVSNTFGERHSYVIQVSDHDGKNIHQACEKGFYVSPFMEMECTYHFSMSPPKERISVLINQKDKDGTILKACFTGDESALSDRAILKLIARYPLMTLKVFVGIHWEALKMWRKGLKLVQRTKAPQNPITYVNMEQKP